MRNEAQRLPSLVRTLQFGVAISMALASAAHAEDDARAAEARRHWPQWRGPWGTGVGPEAEPPVEWSEFENVRWKTALPGLGHSTPIVWGERVFLTTAVPFGKPVVPARIDAPGAHDNYRITYPHKFVVLAVNRSDGEIVWQQTVHEAVPREAAHETASLASASPVTDGEHVFAFFGSRGLYCLDLDGKVVWQEQLGEMDTIHAHGEGSSPALYGETLVVNWDHEGGSFVVAFNKRTGEQLWRVDRNEVTSWATPIVVQHDGRPQVVVSGTGRVRGYDLSSGEIVWECGGLSRNIVASPVAADGMLYVGSSYEKRALLALRLEGASGDLSETDHVVWNRFRGTPYVPSPLLYGESLFFLSHYQGILSRVHGPSGDDRPGALRLEGIGDVYASPVAAAGRVYVTDLNGSTLVIRDGDQPQAMAFNRLNDRFSASAALVGRELYLRGERKLYCIADD